MAAKKDDYTSKDKKEYINHKGLRCPACASGVISSGPLDADGPIATAEVECENCGECWRDYYKLFDVEKLG